jgi:hypothetical protein
MSNYVCIENVDREIWQKVVENSQQGTIFLNMDFIESLSVKYKTFFICKGKEPVAGFVVLLDEQNKPLPSPYPFVPYQGIFFIENGKANTNKIISSQFEITEFIINLLVDLYNGVVSQTHFRVADYRPFSWHNYHNPGKGMFEIVLNYTPILALDKYNSLEEYLLSIRTVRRQEYKKTRAANIQIVDSDDIELLSHLHDLTFQRQGIKQTASEEQLVRSIAQNALKKGYGRLQIAEIDGQPASAIMFLKDKIRGYYLFGATDPQYRNYYASTLLLIENIWKCKLDGLKEVDFVGCNSPQRGDYKLSFDGELTPYYETHLREAEK